jgi:glyoxylase-like metal-dependent hydrolase (beta-lactamase superfamily II)
MRGICLQYDYGGCMSELQFLTNRAAYLPGTNNLGVVVVGDGTAVAIDTGIDKEAGRLLRRACEAAKLQLVAAISTHHHADHVVGNDYLVRNITDFRVYAPRREAPFIEDPYLEPSYLSYGASPIAPLRNKFVMATPSPVHERIEATQTTLTIGAVEFAIFPMPGHSVAQIAVVVEGICYAADSFFGGAVLAKYGVPYAHDVNAQIASLTQVGQLDVTHWIPGHGVLTGHDTIADTLAINHQAIATSKTMVTAACGSGASLQQVVATVQRELGVTSSAMAQYAVFASGISAYLSALHADGVVTVELGADGPMWRAVA